MGRPRYRSAVRLYRLGARLVALGLALSPALALAHGDGEGDLPVTHFPGGGPAATDCLAGLEAVGLDAGTRAKGVTCHDGDPTCDRDRLVNGRCEFWVRACLGVTDARCRLDEDVAAVAVAEADADRDLTMLARTLEQVLLPVVAADTCGALSTVTIPLGSRRNGTPRKARKTIALAATGTAGTTDADEVKFVCKPPAKEKRGRGVSFARIQATIFETQCAFSGCHALDSEEAGLVLEGPGVYDALVNVPASTSAAQFAGKKRIVPGAPSTSFLMDKLLGTLGPGEGERMPIGRSALPASDVEAVRKWILAGAPRQGTVGGGLIGELDAQPRIPPPVAPASGFQAHMDPVPVGGPEVGEMEGCQYVRLDNPDPIAVRAWELFMHEGSHHFILRAARCRDLDGDGLTQCDDPNFDAQFPRGFRPCEEFGYDFAFVVGAQTPHLRVDYQTESTGVALELARRQPLLLNSHYTNPFRDTLAEVWVNVEQVDPLLVRHRARILFSQVANAFIKAPPGTRNADAIWRACAFSGPDAVCDLSGEALPVPTQTHFALMGITSHMHKRTVKFTSDLVVDGVPVSRGTDDMIDHEDHTRHLYVNTDYSDPVNLTFWPPLVVEQGDELRYRCTVDNGVNRPVRLGCEETAGVAPGRSILELVGGLGGAARPCATDADCTGFGTGRCVPANVVFGFLADDEMCIQPGLYYDCPGDAASCTE